jgi:hypothetical protein
MSECEQCGEANLASARFCVVCGSPISATRQPPVSPPREPVVLTGRPEPALNPQPSPAAVLGDDLPLDGPPVLVGFIVSYEGVELGQYWPLHQGRRRIGRRDAAPGSDIEISHPTVSSSHAVLLAGASPSRIVLEDTRSTNGTFVNDNPLSAGQRWELRDGDRVRFGLFNTIVKVV